MSDPVSDTGEDLAAQLDLQEVGTDAFSGVTPRVGWNRVFGGLVVAQALVAAERTVGVRPCHSLHGYFILPGDPSVPIEYRVTRLRDGRSFSTRRCDAYQTGRLIFSLLASFQAPEPGPDYARAMPAVPGPDTLPSVADILRDHGERLPEGVRRWMARARPMELRPTSLDRLLRRDTAVDSQSMWLRVTSPLPADAAVHRAAIAYLSDMTLLDTALVPHRATVFDLRMQAASLDHALWFHRAARADEWLLYVQGSANSTGARGIANGLLYTPDGTLVASVAQEGLLRPRG